MVVVHATLHLRQVTRETSQTGTLLLLYHLLYLLRHNWTAMSSSHANGDGNAAAGPSGTNGSTTAADSVPQLTPGPSPYHESSQFLHWRYAPEQLSTVRAELNAKSVEVVARNSELEKVPLPLEII